MSIASAPNVDIIRQQGSTFKLLETMLESPKKGLVPCTGVCSVMPRGVTLGEIGVKAPK